jgi:hypothetical protein
MSQYRLFSPVDIQTNSSPGTIHIFNGSTNHTSLRSPSVLTANRPFVLPAGAGVIGQYLTYGASSNAYSAGSPNNTSLPMHLKPTGTTSNTPASVTSNAYTIIATANWRGTATEGTPTAVRVVLSGNTNGRVRIFNRQAATTAAELILGGPLTATPTIFTIPITGGFTAGAQILEVQSRRQAAGTVSCWYVQIIP